MKTPSTSDLTHAQANTAYDRLAVISDHMPMLHELCDFIFDLQDWLKANQHKFLQEFVDNMNSELEVVKARLESLALTHDRDKVALQNAINSINTIITNLTSDLAQRLAIVNNNPTLSWGQTSTIGTIGNTSLTVTMPVEPSQDLNEYISTRGYNPTGDNNYRVSLEYHTRYVSDSSSPDQWSETGWYIVVRSPRTGLPYEKYLISPTESSGSGNSGTSSSGTGRIIIPGFAGNPSSSDFTGGVLNNTYTTEQLHTGILNGQGMGGGDGSMSSGTNKSESASKYYAPATWKCIKAPTIHTEQGGNKVLDSQGYFELIEYIFNLGDKLGDFVS